MKLIAGNSNIPLAREMAEVLGIPLTESSIRRFSDMEIFVEVMENVRGEDVFLLQSTSYPANDHIMELLIMLDALKRASARRVTVVIPYFGYARQDRKPGPRTPITAKLVANLITEAGADRVLTVDLHAGQIQGFFDIPLDHLYARPVIVQDIKTHYTDLENLMIVSPDVGGVVRARSLSGRLGVDLAIVDKRREKINQSEVMNIIGDVKGRDCILFDDIVDTAGTLCNAAEALINHGAKSVSAYVTHGVLSGPAVERVANSRLTSLVVTNSIAPSAAVQNARNIRFPSPPCWPRRSNASPKKAPFPACSIKQLLFNHSPEGRGGWHRAYIYL
jgi:ribose-phosphate pyrophosphokinase